MRKRNRIMLLCPSVPLTLVGLLEIPGVVFFAAFSWWATDFLLHWTRQQLPHLRGQVLGIAIFGRKSCHFVSKKVHGWVRFWVLDQVWIRGSRHLYHNFFASFFRQFRVQYRIGYRMIICLYFLKSWGLSLVILKTIQESLRWSLLYLLS